MMVTLVRRAESEVGVRRCEGQRNGVVFRLARKSKRLGDRISGRYFQKVQIGVHIGRVCRANEGPGRL